MAETSQKKVIVIGAGLAGLVCARTLQRAGLDVHVYEASDGVGGRVRSDVVDGLTLDRGFQVLFTAYPAVQKELDLAALELEPFDPGALVYWKGELYNISDPFRNPRAIISSITNSLFSFRDKIALLRLRKLIGGLDITDIFLLPDQNTHDFLVDQGFTGKFIGHFAQPFYGGVFLSRSLDTSARMFAFTFKMLLEGQAVIPAKGMGAIPAQIAAGIGDSFIHLNSPVSALEKVGDSVTGIRLEDGSVVHSDIVVVAVAADAAARLTGLKLPQEHRSTINAYIELPAPLGNSRSIMLFAEPNKYAGSNSLINNAVMISNISRDLAPQGRHLLSLSIIGEPRVSDKQILDIAAREIGGHFPGSNTNDWKLIKVYRIPWAQFSQPAGIYGRLPKADTGVNGLVLSGEILCHSSIQGALEAGQLSAQEVQYRLGILERPRKKPHRVNKVAS